MAELYVVEESASLPSAWQEIFSELHFVLAPPAYEGACLVLREEGPVLRGPHPSALQLSVNFMDSALRARKRQFQPRKELLLRALGTNRPLPRLVDATAGLGRESFLLATYGFEVEAWEKNPYLYVLLSLAAEQLFAHLGLAMEQRRLHFRFGDSEKFLLSQAPELHPLVYFDPMFPEGKKSAQVKKNMQVLQQLDLSSADPLASLHRLKAHGLAKIVIKRPRAVPILDTALCSRYYENDTLRFEVYE